MRKVLLSIFLASIGLVCLVSCLGLVIADQNLIPSTSPLFPIQRFTEAAREGFIKSTSGRAAYDLALVERRLVTLSQVAGTPGEVAALQTLDEALDQVQNTLSIVPENDRRPLVSKMAALIEKITVQLAILTYSPSEAGDLVSRVRDRVNSLLVVLAIAPSTKSFEQSKGNPRPDILNNDPGLLKPLIAMDFMPGATITGTVAPHSIQFPPGSRGAEHAFYPLLGTHAALTCESCHVTGQFAGTASQCEACHSNVKPVMHFNGDCASCHTPYNWNDVLFDHNQALATDCRSCHISDKPANHYQAQCSACHDVSAWQPASFNHQAAGATDCRTCHSSDEPANHYHGQCSACHNTNNWQQTDFNHKAAGATDCQSCHSRPDNHFAGQCSQCHNTNDWQDASFSHQGLTDCQSCHSRPDNHFGGQCSQCHNTSGWQDASFSHEGLTDCQSCHSRPDNHFGGQCSQCHNTNDWQDASFSHQGLTDCQSCHSRPDNHFAGQCSACHSTNSWGGASFSHQGLTDCQSCHSAPSGHWTQQCSRCHDPGDWGDANVNGHTFPMDHEGADGSCSTCHENNTPAYTCYRCHDQSETRKHHEEKGILDVDHRCTECHSDGDKD